MNHSFITAVMPFEARRAADIRKLLDAMGNPVTADITARLDGTNCIHFMGIHVLPLNDDRAYLIVDASADGGNETALRHLEAAIGPELRALILAAGIDMGAQTVAGMLELYSIKVSNGWFGIPGIDFDGSPRMSVKRIKDEAALAREITDLLDQPFDELSRLATLQRIRKTLWDNDAKKWAFFTEPTPFLQDTLAKQDLTAASIFDAFMDLISRPLLLSVMLGWIVGQIWGPDWGVSAALLAFAAGLFAQGKPPPDQVTQSIIWLSVALMFWPLLLAVAVVSGLTWWLAGLCWAAVTFATTAIVAGLLPLGVYLILLKKEKKDEPVDLPPSSADIEAMMVHESFAAQNLLAAASTVKPGFIRSLTLRFGLAAADVAAKFYSTPGFLTDIGVIHFARWFRLPGTDKLMFFSNYDGAWESYLEDFIERGFKGVTGIWSNTVGFPRTHQLLNGGARDGDRLRRWTRRQMFPVRFWYTAYPALTLARIRINAKIRRGLATIQTEKEAAEWLALFGTASVSAAPVKRRRPRMTQLAPPPPVSIEKPDENIELEQVPTMLFGALSHLRFGAAVFVHFGYKSAREWLQQVRKHVTYGDGRGTSTAMVLGLTHSGLQGLGIGPEDLATFPVPFLQGSYAPWRARAIGDVCRNDPERWSWGGPGNSVDAVVVTYAQDRSTLDALVDARKREIESFGHEIAYCVRLKDLPEDNSKPPAEAFGYVDGVSQPIIRGINRSALQDQQRQVVAPGEFIMGYADNQNFVPPSPTVPATTDPDQLLPNAPPGTAGWPPHTSKQPKEGERRDLGRNGTFMVIRQLEQNVGAFTDFLDAKGKDLAGDPRLPKLGSVAVRDWLGAKIVGRWKDGSSLNRNPRRPSGGPPDNDFIYGTDDVSGGNCPFGAHIRRANPRDSFDPRNEIQLAITNRHRILRRGRSYTAQNGLEHPGLMFMCLNVDIERQFEFVQQTWLLAPSFNGLEHERDTMLTRGANHLTIPTSNGPLRVRCMQDFITVRGSGYFFLPGRGALQYMTQNVDKQWARTTGPWSSKPR